MSASIHLAKVDDAAAILPMVEAFHSEMQLETSPEQREAGLLPILEGSPHGCVYLIGPRNAPIGYIVVCFGWSLEFGGLDGFIDEFFIRRGVRGRGMGTEVLGALLPKLEEAGLKALHLEANRGDQRLHRLYSRAGFALRENYALMSRLARA